jgi:short subunit fatty acids transporter
LERKEGEHTVLELAQFWNHGFNYILYFTLRLALILITYLDLYIHFIIIWQSRDTYIS